eukprot:754904-Hanusia_phi.AAC.3
MLLQGDGNITICQKRMGKLQQLAHIQDKQDAKMFAKMFLPGKEKPRIKPGVAEEEQVVSCWQFCKVTPPAEDRDVGDKHQQI